MLLLYELDKKFLRLLVKLKCQQTDALSVIVGIWLYICHIGIKVSWNGVILYTTSTRSKVPVLAPQFSPNIYTSSISLSTFLGTIRITPACSFLHQLWAKLIKNLSIHNNTLSNKNMLMISTYRPLFTLIPKVLWDLATLILIVSLLKLEPKHLRFSMDWTTVLWS